MFQGMFCNYTVARLVSGFEQLTTVIFNSIDSTVI